VRNYEAMYIIRSNLDEEATKATMEKMHAIIARGGTVTDVTVMGKKRLAYEIDDFRDGFYVLVRFAGDGAVVKELDRVFRITDEILRFLIVVDESATA
jgi:small subunit ribosomal protein S6